MLKEKYKNVTEFKDDLHKESVVKLVQDMGYVREDEMYGSKISCMFHMGDKTPSLQITDDYFRCYGCGARGDIIKFVELKEKISFYESIKFIADFLNIELMDTNISREQKMKSKLNAEWNHYKDSFVSKSKEASMLLEIGKRFFPQQVGYDPKMNYIVLPFTSKTGGILGFTKRRINENDTPKWKHSSLQDSLVGLCSNVFNLNMAWDKIQENGELFVVEGPGDVASMQKASVLNTIAVCGTSNFSDRVVDVLSPITKVTFVYDGDNAGKHASIMNSIYLAKTRPDIFSKLHVVDLPEGKDPGDMNPEDLKNLVHDHSENALKWFVKNANDEEIGLMNESMSSELLRPKFLHEVGNLKNFTLAQVNEWLKFQSLQKKNKLINNKDESPDDLYFNQLLSTIGKGGDMNVEPLNMAEDQARKILKLRFNYQ